MKTFPAHVTANGRRLVMANDIAWRAGVATFAGEEVLISVRKLYGGPSKEQRGYYFGVVVSTLAKALVWEVDEVHAGLKSLFLSVESPTGLRRVGSTTELTPVQFEDYLERIRQWAKWQLGLEIPLPQAGREVEP